MCEHDALTINAIAKDHIRVICARCGMVIVEKADYSVMQGDAALAALSLWRPTLVPGWRRGKRLGEILPSGR